MGRSHEAPPIREPMACPTAKRRLQTGRSALERSGEARVRCPESPTGEAAMTGCG